MKNNFLYITLIIISCTLVSCKGQKDQNNNKSTMNMNNKENAPYNIYKDGELEINYDKLIIKNKEQIENEFNKFNYQYPSLNLFIEKIKYYYGVNIDKYKENIVVLDQSLSPVIAIKNLPALYVEDIKGDIDGLTLLHYNQFIFCDNKSSLEWLKKERPDLIIELVKTFGFDKNNTILKYAFSNTNFRNKFDVKELIFEERNHTYILREHLVDKIREIEYNNQIINAFSETIQGDFYYTLSDIIKDIADTPNDYKNNEYSIAFLLNELALSGITGYIDYFYENYPFYKKNILNNDFYNFKMLKKYTEKVYENNDLEAMYYIQDPDGFTNLRKEKNSKSEIVQQIKNGEKVEVLNEEGKWWLIKTQKEKQGYVYYDRVKVK